MKKIIRRVVNWAFGRNLRTDINILTERVCNLSITLHDNLLRQAFKESKQAYVFGEGDIDILSRHEQEITDIMRELAESQVGSFKATINTPFGKVTFES